MARVGRAHAIPRRRRALPEDQAGATAPLPPAQPYAGGGAAGLLHLSEFSSTSEFLQQAQRRYTSGVHHRNWLALAEAFVSEASRRGGRYKTGRCKNHKCWREAIRFVAVSQEGAGAFLNAIPMRDDMKMETWAMRITVQRRLGLPLDVACQAVEAGKKAPNGKPHEELGDAAMVNPRAKHATRHKFLLKRLVKTLRSAWGMLIEMEPTAHLSCPGCVPARPARRRGARPPPTSPRGAAPGRPGRPPTKLLYYYHITICVGVYAQRHRRLQLDRRR